jgi:Mce-associated membrane protein
MRITMAPRPSADGTQAETTAIRTGAGWVRQGLRWVRQVLRPVGQVLRWVGQVLRWVGSHRGQVALSGAVVLLIAAGTALTAATVEVRHSPAASNRALTDATATRQVAAAVSSDLVQIFSYTYTNLRPTQLAARAVLAGTAARQYGELFPELHNAVGQKLSVTSKVSYAGVTRLSGGSAQLLVFMNQTATRGLAAVGNTPYHAQLAITAQLHDGRWRIVAIAAR